MNTLKKCILLGILTLNLMPYLQDGNLKWTTTGVAAQLYYTENVISAGFEWQCGETAHLYDESYFFKSLIICEWLVARPDAEPSYNYSDVNFGFSINEPSSPGGKWCTFCVLFALKPIYLSPQNTDASQSVGSTSNNNSGPWIYAKDYFTSFRTPSITDESEMLLHGMFSSDFVSFFSKHGVTCSPGISAKNEIINAMNPNKGLILIRTIGPDEDHTLLLRRVKKDDDETVANAHLYFYDPMNVQEDCTIAELDFSIYHTNYVVSKP